MKHKQVSLAEADKVIAGLLGAMESAISIGDWDVDGRCDPAVIMAAASSYLAERGYRSNDAEIPGLEPI